jgi:serine/threonine protein kinase
VSTPKPTLQEYQEAIQRPDLCFEDSDLKRGRPVAGVFNLPKVISGGFAGVFQIKKGSRSYAARCFLKDVPDNEKRYKAISSFLKRKRIPYFAKFEYIDKGIQVKGSWYPLLKMEWLNGVTLGEYIERNRRDAKIMEDLVAKFKVLIESLKKRGISHGDLHDQNIMVVNGELKVIDYDAMFVQGLEGFESSELGHTNYQHPERRLSDFGPYVDNFSEWVIYLSLLALVKKPDIWEKLNGGDQCLLFRSGDFEDPEASRAFAAIEAIPDDNLRILTDAFKDAVYTYNLEDIPSIVNEKQIINKRRKLYTEVAKIPQVSTEGFKVEVPQADRSWIWSSKKIEYKNFKKSFKLEKSMLILTVIYVLTLGLLFIVYGVSIHRVALYSIGLPFPLLMIPTSYYFSEVVKNRNNKASRIRWLEEEIKLKRKTIQRDVDSINRLKEETNRKIKELKQEIVDLRNEESLELKKSEASYWARLRRLSDERKSIIKQENNELETLLKELQKNYVMEKLSTHRVRDSNIRGIGFFRGLFLARGGVKTAADFIDVNVRNSLFFGVGARFRLRNGKMIHIRWISPAQSTALRRWRNQLTEKYKIMIPKELPSSLKDQVEHRYEEKLSKLQIEEEKAKTDLQVSKKNIKDKYTKLYDSLKLEIEKHKKHHDTIVNRMRGQLTEKCSEVESLDWEMSNLEHELKGYESISFKNYFKEIVS